MGSHSKSQAGETAPRMVTNLGARRLRLLMMLSMCVFVVGHGTPEGHHHILESDVDALDDIISDVQGMAHDSHRRGGEVERMEEVRADHAREGRSRGGPRAGWGP